MRSRIGREGGTPASPTRSTVSTDSGVSSVGASLDVTVTVLPSRLVSGSPTGVSSSGSPSRSKRALAAT
ncbi:hypothetical protein [Halobacterium rubrum]|uniref:hypothetical protein n=1 Tax=Halobacterium TaxID=2239 RepID=UPI001F286C4B|nr:MULTISPECIES: hypothetical protein [Halobacterium]MDH5019740.1 hypothetical protein [Halobacterium rubrum]